MKFLMIGCLLIAPLALNAVTIVNSTFKTLSFSGHHDGEDFAGEVAAGASKEIVHTGTIGIIVSIDKGSVTYNNLSADTTLAFYENFEYDEIRLVRTEKKPSP